MFFPFPGIWLWHALILRSQICLLFFQSPILNYVLSAHVPRLYILGVHSRTSKKTQKPPKDHSLKKYSPKITKPFRNMKHYILYVLVILTPKSSCDFVSLPSNDSNNAASAAESWLKKASQIKATASCATAGGGETPQWKVKICAVLYTPCGITRKGVKDVKGEDEWSGDIQVYTIFDYYHFFVPQLDLE